MYSIGVQFKKNAVNDDEKQRAIHVGIELEELRRDTRRWD